MSKTVETLKKINQEKIERFTSEGNKKELRKQEIISEFLDAPWQFLNMPMEMAYSMLSDLGVREEDMAEVYNKLIS